MNLLNTLELLFLTVRKSGQGKVVTRIAPSPTGNLHVGTARTALFNYLFAKRHGGTFLIRIENTDAKRSTKEFEDDILESLRWLSLTGDALYRQSERTDIYLHYLELLIGKKKAYLSKEQSAEEPEREVEVVRLRNPGSVVAFTDLIHGDITFDTKELGDFIIARSLSDALYHFAVVVDDYDMGITHVIRGEDHISNPPRQILIQEALGFPRPAYAHIPLILAPDRSKLSKRHGATSIREYRDEGFLPEAMVNYLALLGWNPGTEQELFTLSELVSEFSLEKIHKGGAIFDREKLRWFNREYIRRLPQKKMFEILRDALPDDLKRLPDFSDLKLQRIVPLLIERISVFSDIAKLSAEGELQYFFKRPSIDPKELVWKDADAATTAEHLAHIHEKIQAVPESLFTAEHLKEIVFSYATEKGRGAVLWPMRYALSGKKKSPDPFTLAGVLGKEEVLARLKAASATIAE